MVITSRSVIQTVYDDNCPSGIVKTSGKVIEDIRKVVGYSNMPQEDKVSIVFGILGESSILDSYTFIDRDDIAGKREVYGFYISGSEIIIAGSDKRGTIYGLYHISELIGISPLVNWSLAEPGKHSEIVFSEKDNCVSKEPSVKYRGFFINDEWPAFGTWCRKHFGGMNARMYEHVFELLLRMKGNYLWPAMWASVFACDGPGLKAAELADEYGVVMGLSHHEPCLRSGEEYSHLRGKDSIYGDAWDFRTNREGIIRFWRDGLKRNGHLENVITIGMRGERDSAILGDESALGENIALLRDVIKTQNELIKENVNADLEKVPRMLALYKEVEPYYYGDEKNEGLCTYDELDDVILMLCDDNHGYLRTLPDEKMRSHKGGFGMYYHFDYHGSPVSYEWINSTYLPVVWEQMTTCYEHGVNSLWIVNVGDLGLNEMPLCYFMDLAYDFDKWGSGALNSTVSYTREWMSRQFGTSLSDEDTERLTALYTAYTRLMHNRRPEHMNENIYHVRSYGEAAAVLNRIAQIRSELDIIEKKIAPENKAAFTELISYSVRAGLNLVEMWINTGYNHFYSSIGAVCANRFADKVRMALQTDRTLTENLHYIGGGKFDGFGLAPHIGFRNWNCEESVNPVLHSVIPVSGQSIKIGLLCESAQTAGLEWTGKTLDIRRFGIMEKDGKRIRYAGFFAAQCGTEDVSYTADCDCDWLIIDKNEGTLSSENSLIEHIITISYDKLPAPCEDGIIRAEAQIKVCYGNICVRINVHIEEPAKHSEDVYFEENGAITIPADGFSRNEPRDGRSFTILNEAGRTGSAVKVLPIAFEKLSPDNAPYAEYSIFSGSGGEYSLTFGLAPNNPYRSGRMPQIAYSVNNGPTIITDVLDKGYCAGTSADWGQGVLEHIHFVQTNVSLSSGMNTLIFYGICPETVLESITLVRNGTYIPESYLGQPLIR